MYYGTGWKKLRPFDASKIKARKNFPFRRFQRAPAQIQICSTGEVLPGRVFLHDWRVNGMSLFLMTPLRRDEEVFVVVEEPRHVFVRGRIEWCGIYRLHAAVITAENYQYRAAIRFEFETEEERMLLARYLEEFAVK